MSKAKTLLATALFGAALPAFAATVSYTYTFSPAIGETTTLGNKVVFAGSGSDGSAMNVTVSAWASSAASVTSNGYISTSDSTSRNSLIEQAYLESSGTALRVDAQGEGETSPNHAMDNSGKLEAILFDFGQTGGVDNKVSLDQFMMSWTTNDSDFDVMAYTAGVSGYDVYTSLLANSFNSLKGSAGWSAVGNTYTNVGTSTVSVDDTVPVQSRYWLIGADGIGGEFSDKYFDYGKIATIVTSFTKPGGTTGTGVPEPTSLALIGGALAAMVFSRSRKAG